MNRLITSLAGTTASVTRLSIVTSRGLRLYSTSHQYVINQEAFKSSYNSVAVEENKYQWWKDNGYFKPSSTKTEDTNNKNKKRFSMVLPPPNVTGSLHIGHALTTTIEDALVRYKRMMGYDTLWVPGLDHSGIATQVAVEKEIMVKQGLSRHDLGREKFLEQVFKWTDKYSANINTQLEKTGSSLDWSRSVFTLDDKRALAVQTAFLTLYRRGLIYRSTRLVNWCAQLQSVISDIEVDHITFEKPTMYKLKTQPRTHEFGVIHDVKYRIDDDSKEEYLVVSTTRVETIFGDTAIAVHPKDERYKHLIGKMCRHPFSDRLIPVVGDDILVDMTLGTGAVKVTPAHDFNDYQCGQRHKLEFINIMCEDGKLNEHCGEFSGKDRLMSRHDVIKALKEKGLYEGKRPHPTALAVCSRSGDLLEPILKPQWYVDCKEMGARAAQFARDDKLKFVPESYQADWLRWLDNIQDWCISRQLWWGNPIPAYRVIADGITAKDEKWVVGEDLETATESAIKTFGLKRGAFELIKDDDVLDTWFSSSLFPMSALGWPDNKSLDLSKFYPLDVMETGSDIMFFWVARMVMMCSTLFDANNQQQPPFETVLLHPLIRDSQGRKMSKSLGNVIDPLHVINGIELPQLVQNLRESNLSEQEKNTATKGLEKEFPKGIPQCGTDALRIALSQFPISGKDINLDLSRIIGQRLFCNKIWNAAKLVLMTIDKTNSVVVDNLEHPIYYQGDESVPWSNDSISVIDRWILNRLGNLTTVVEDAFSTLNLSVASQALYTFFQYDYCDFYLEMTKASLSLPTIKQSNQHSVVVMRSVLETFLRLAHPFMPYITEDLWQRLPKHASAPASIMIAEYPSPSTYSLHNSCILNQGAEPLVESIQSSLHFVRSTRKSSNIHPQTKINLTINTNHSITLEALKNQIEEIEKMVNCNLSFNQTIINNNNNNFETIQHKVDENCLMILQYDKVANNGLLNKNNPAAAASSENQELNARKKKLEEWIKDIETTISNPSFKQRVPQAVQQTKIEKLNQLREELKLLEQQSS
ncbi:hypothetical protein DFA_11815 [Cavenderia fasciculata]|uniref:valine--tRNA ligase n=1 Tax=Cavenderia fasciculata TaxID=261658 RepID=F4QEA5_CACFS|nr:uncharacterized protein DFA_11815 [Cavenderia fasciculata]EGG14052.1 hypothetical protein DFA_11815 [Cavenderia fasciculata]|eukprot:XP_004350760.1 hypothetical protein DFA_11815 [Cavenderia fasciculata]